MTCPDPDPERGSSAAYWEDKYNRLKALHDIGKEFHALVIKERNYERVKNARLQTQLDAVTDQLGELRETLDNSRSRETG